MDYVLTESDEKTLNNNFTYHSPHGDQGDRYTSLRAEAKRLALEIHRLCPPSRERALAITNLEQAVFWANAAIARNEGEAPAVNETAKA